MQHSGPATIAYYTVVEDERTGWTGGLLLLNHLGRPLEFQCTLPVRPSRAHLILYGSTLREYLIGELIGPQLMQACRAPISLLCCDQPEAFPLGQLASFPVVMVDQKDVPAPGSIAADLLAGSVSATLVGAEIRCAAGRLDSVRQIAAELAHFPDVTEPFERIREAIREAQSQLANSVASGRETAPAERDAA